MNCLDCNKPATVKHHVVPRSRGGKSTVDLCQECHDLAHGVGPRNISIATLTKEALKKVKAAGVKLGGVPFGFRQSYINDKRQFVIDENEYPTVVLINNLRDQGNSYREVAKLLIASGVKTKNVGKWTHRQVAKICRSNIVINEE